MNAVVAPATPRAQPDRWLGASRVGTLAFAVLAYLPALLSAPGRMPADTKLYLYLDPGRQLADSLNSWDSRQFAGWVPHQTVGYLWPTGPYYWLCDRIGLPDWIAHRLWIGTLLFVAALGARWCARHFGVGIWPATVAGVVYATAPYVLPYIGRTSVLLPPWAALGWLLGLTIRISRTHRWGDVAWFALVIATIGGINATALLMIAPMPVLWLLDQAFRRAITWGQALADAAKIGGAALLASLWWLIPLAVQGRYGAPALSFSETLEAVSLHANATESMRGLGYWLLYLNDRGTPLTSAGETQQTSAVVMGAAWIIILAGVAGLVFVRWQARRFAAMSAFVALVLAIGVHPIEHASPLFRPLAEASRSGAALAVRSSTRALPVLLLLFAVACAVLLDSLRRWRPPVGVAVSVVLVGLSLANNPALVTASLVDPALDREQHPPASWLQAAAAIDALPGDGRVLYLPGAESGVYTWGTTVDPPLPGLVDRAVIGRDWLPLGSPGVMDFLYAFDDRFQDNRADPRIVAPAARLLGADTIFFTSDGVRQRFGTADPATVWRVLQAAVDSGDLREVGRYGMTGDGVPSTAVFEVVRPASIARAAAETVSIVGGGSGALDAAEAGLIDGHQMINFVANGPPTSTARALIVTDTNRKQAHHWRGSQDVRGMTEDERPAIDGIDIADHRFAAYADLATTQQTLARQIGSVTARASHYGSSVAYWPEYRAAMALDADPRTAWLTDRGVGTTLTLTPAAELGGVQTLALTQPADGRRITEVTIRTGRAARSFPLTAPAGRASDTIDIGALQHTAGQPIAVTIVGVRGTVDGLIGFAEVNLGQAEPTVENVELPAVASDFDLSAQPTAFVFSRVRGDSLEASRRDPEPTIRRRFELSATTTFEMTIVASGPDTPTDLSPSCIDDSIQVDGSPVAVRAVEPTNDGVRTLVACEPLTLSAGSHLMTTSADGSFGHLDRVTLSTAPIDVFIASVEPATPVTAERGRSTRRLEVPSCPVGCWVSMGEGWSDGWTATRDVDAPPLGTALRVDAGMSGWWVPPTETPSNLVATWTPQRAMNLGVWISAFTMLGAVVVARPFGRSRRRAQRHVSRFGESHPFGAVGDQSSRLEWPLTTRMPWRSVWWPVVFAGLVGAATIAPKWGMLAALITAASALLRRPRLAALVGTAALGVVGARCLAIVALRQPAPGFRWTDSFEHLHRQTLLGVLLVLVGLLSDGGRSDRSAPSASPSASTPE